MIGSLLYLIASRPNIMFSVFLCARFQANSKESHLKEVKRIFRYLKENNDLCLWYPRNISLELMAYTNIDFAGHLVDSKEYFRNGLVPWIMSCLMGIEETKLSGTLNRRSRICGSHLMLFPSAMDKVPTARLWFVLKHFSHTL